MSGVAPDPVYPKEEYLKSSVLGYDAVEKPQGRSTTPKRPNGKARKQSKRKQKQSGPSKRDRQAKKTQQRDMATAPAAEPAAAPAAAPATVAAATAAGAAAAGAAAGDPAVVAAQAAEDATEPAADATPAPTDWTLETVQGMVTAEKEQVTWLKTEQVRVAQGIEIKTAELVTAEAELVTATSEKDTAESELATLVATGTATTDALSAKEASVKAYVGQYGSALGARNNLNSAIAVANVELTHTAAEITKAEQKVADLEALEVTLNTR